MSATTEQTEFLLGNDATVSGHTLAVQRACQYIHDHIDEDFGLNDLAKAAYMSPFHLHRVFSRLLGENVKTYVRRLRLERSAFELKIGEKPIVTIALDAGYKAHETFTRAFRKRFGINPSVYRQKYGLLENHEACSPLGHPRWLDPKKITITKLSALRVAYFRIDGPYRHCLETNTLNSTWQVPPQQLQLHKIALVEPTFRGNCHDEPTFTQQSPIRFNAAILVSPEGDGDNFIRRGASEPDHYAVARHYGAFQNLGESYQFLTKNWITQSAYRLRNLPPLEAYQLGSPGSEPGIDIYIPIEPSERKT